MNMRSAEEETKIELPKPVGAGVFGSLEPEPLEKNPGAGAAK